MPRPLFSCVLAAILVASLFTAACADPPEREIEQAQAAVDAARTAHADRFAAEEYEAAVKALENSRSAVSQRDYRLALNHALDSRERAQAAAKQATAREQELRSGAERRLGEITAMLDHANKQVTAAQAARVPQRSLAESRTAIASAQSSLQKAGTEIHEGNYEASQKLLEGAAADLKKAVDELAAASKSRRAKPRT